ncbi:MAG: RNA methyltransferase [Bacteroidales bacterium]|nr:RNA methyltransferase [Bacteroidales bacterium]
MQELSKTKLKSLTAYKQQKQCNAEQVFVVEGIKLCQEALRSSFNVLTICAVAQWWDEQNEIIPDSCDCYVVSHEMLERLSGQQKPNAVWMLVERPYTAQPPAAGSLSHDKPTLVLDNLQDPGNMGTIIRTADWFGIRQIVCSPDTVSCYNPKVVQSTMGGIFRTQIAYCNIEEYIGTARANDIAVYGAVLDGATLYDTPLHTPALLVIGNEAHGISAPVLALIDNPLTIPNVGGTCESLNAAVATAIICSEFASTATH